MIKLALVLISTGYFGAIKSQCSYESTHLFCTNLEKSKDNITLIVGNIEKSQNPMVETAYFRNISGKITNETLASFPKIQSLDIQFSYIDEFTPQSSTLNTLYIINNFKFPNLTKDLLNNCCKHFTTLFIVNNTKMKIEEGALKQIKNLSQLTVSKQNITSLTRGFLDGLGNLTYLNLKQNGINMVDDEAFEDLLELNYLDLSENNVKTFEANTFENLKVLETLELYGLKLDEFNPNIFSKQKELKYLGVPTLLIKNKLKLQTLTKTFPKLEIIGIQGEDKEDKDVAEFVTKCEVTGFYIKYSIRNAYFT